MRDVMKLGLRLFLFTLIAALALAGTYAITSGPIAQQELAASQGAQRAVLPTAEIFEEQEIQSASEYDQITALYAGKAGDAIVGYVMTAAPQGYGGPIPITLGIGADGAIHGVSVGDLQETAGLGMKVGEEPFKSQFPGLAADPEEIDAKVQTISGATVSSRPFIAAVRQMVAYSKDVLGIEPNAATPELEGDDLVRKEYVASAEAFSALDVMSLIGDYGAIKSIYQGTVGDDAVGYVFELSSKGFADQIGLRMGITTDGIISKVVMTENNETEGYGTKTKEPSFTEQFTGKTATADAYMEGVEAVSGATVSSNAVFKAVGQAVDFYNTYLVAKEEPASAGDVYEVSGFGPMKIAIAVEDGKIASFEVVEHSETPGFGADLIEKGFDSLIGQDVQTASFDAVSGATMTSNGINDALKQAAEKAGSASAGDVYEVSGFGPMKIAIAVEDGKIASFEVVEHSETPGFGADLIEKGFDSLIGQDVQTASFDAVSGATMTSNGINDALKQAAEKNGAVVETAAAAPEATQEPAAGEVYEVSGFAPMKIAIAVEDGKIASFEVVEHSETPGIGADLIEKGFDSLIGQDIQTASFDAVSGATVTSGAINEALKQAAEKNGAAAPATETTPEATQEPAAPAAGEVYEVTGFAQPIKVAIAVEDGKIASFDVLEHGETPGFGADLIEKGFDSLIGQDIQTASFDAVSGATVTSSAINEALKQAAEKNGAAAPATEATPEATQEAATVGEPVATYVGSGKGFGGDLTIEVSVDANDMIVSAAVVSHSETPDIGAPVAETGLDVLVGQKVGEAQIDAVSGSTYTSDAINHALRNLYKKGEATPAPEAFEPRPTAVISTEGKAIATVAPENKQVPVQLAAASPVEAATSIAVGEPVATYVGTGKGFGGDLTIEVNADANDLIVSAAVVSHSETPDIGAPVAETGLDALVGRKVGEAQIDAVSGSTYTSDAINHALRNLYKKGEATPAPEAFEPRPTAVISTEGKAIATVAPENKQVPVQLAAASPVEAATQAPAATAAPALEAAEGKIYEVQGFAPMKVAITLEAGKITAFEVVEHGETPGFGADLIEKGFDSLIGQEIETASFDAVSGATVTSDAINAALKMAAEEVQE